MNERLLERIYECDSTLTSLELFSEKLNDDDLVGLGKAIKKNTIITSLKFTKSLFSKPGFSQKGLKSLCEALVENNTLTHLDFYANYDGSVNYRSRSDWDEWANELAILIKGNHCLTTLNLSLNLITAAGLQILAPAIKINDTLTDLDLSYNEIGYGGSLLADCLKTNNILRILNLEDCKIGNTGALALASVLEKNKGLTKLYLGGNDIQNSAFKAFEILLCKNFTLTNLSLSTISSLEASKGYSTRNDFLNKNEMSEDTTYSLVRAMANNYSILELKLYGHSHKYRSSLESSEKRNRENQANFFRECASGNLEKCKQFINLGVSIHGVDYNGMTALHFAAQAGHGPVVEYLIHKGGYIRAKNKRNQTPADLARLNKHLDLVKYFSTSNDLQETNSQNNPAWKASFDKAREFYNKGKAFYYTKDITSSITFFTQSKDNYKDVLNSQEATTEAKKEAEKRTSKLKNPNGKYCPVKLTS